MWSRSALGGQWCCQRQAKAPPCVFISPSRLFPFQNFFLIHHCIDVSASYKAVAFVMHIRLLPTCTCGSDRTNAIGQANLILFTPFFLFPPLFSTISLYVRISISLSLPLFFWGWGKDAGIGQWGSDLKNLKCVFLHVFTHYEAWRVVKVHFFSLQYNWPQGLFQSCTFSPNRIADIIFTQGRLGDLSEHWATSKREITVWYFFHKPPMESQTDQSKTQRNIAQINWLILSVRSQLVCREPVYISGQVLGENTRNKCPPSRALLSVNEVKLRCSRQAIWKKLKWTHI